MDAISFGILGVPSDAEAVRTHLSYSLSIRSSNGTTGASFPTICNDFFV